MRGYMKWCIRRVVSRRSSDSSWTRNWPDHVRCVSISISVSVSIGTWWKRSAIHTIGGARGSNRMGNRWHNIIVISTWARNWRCSGCTTHRGTDINIWMGRQRWRSRYATRTRHHMTLYFLAIGANRQTATSSCWLTFWRHRCRKRCHRGEEFR